MNSSKIQTRKAIHDRLAAITDANYRAWSQKVHQQVRTTFKELHTNQAINSVLLYSAVSQWREVDISWLEQVYGTICFEYAPVSPAAPLPPEKYDIIFVPLYGFNERKYRLGHGMGWYDRLLALQPQAIKVGVGLEVGRCEFTEEPHDVALDYIITERPPEILQRKTHR